MKELPFFVPHTDEHLAAVVTPTTDPPSSLALLLGTLGAPRSHRFGIFTSLARRLAGSGVAAARMDFSGLGDSTGDVRVRPFDAPVAEEARAVLDVALRVTGATRFVAVGTCWGSSVAHELAHEDPRCVGLVAIRPPTELAVASDAPGDGGANASSLARLLERARVLLVNSDGDPFFPAASAYLERVVPALPASVAGRCETLVVSGGSLDGFESLDLQRSVMDATFGWIIRHFTAGDGGDG